MGSDLGGNELFQQALQKNLGAASMPLLLTPAAAQRRAAAAQTVLARAGPATPLALVLTPSRRARLHLFPRACVLAAAAQISFATGCTTARRRQTPPAPAPTRAKRR